MHPPACFVSRAYLEACRELLDTDGMLVINLGCRSQELGRRVKSTVEQVFMQGAVYELPTSEDINRIIFALPRPRATQAAALPDSIRACLAAAGVHGDPLGLLDQVGDMMTLYSAPV
jgi:hypothetical protein